MSHERSSSALDVQDEAGPGDKNGDTRTVVTEIPDGRDASHQAPERTMESPPEETDRQAIERAEDEGMIVHQNVTSSVRKSTAHT
jgi:hypothetical protein